MQVNDKMVHGKTLSSFLFPAQNGFHSVSIEAASMEEALEKYQEITHQKPEEIKTSLDK